MIPKKGLGNTSAAFAIITIALVASIGIFSLGSQTLSGGKRPTTGVISPLTGSDTSSVISSNGLRLTLSLLQTTFSEGRGIPINVSLFNTLSTQNNIAEASNRTQFGLGPCSQLPLGVGILDGYYDRTNLSSGAPLGLFYPGFYSCPAEFAVAYWSFAPLSDEATLVSQQPTGIGNTTGPRDMWTQKAEAGLEYWGYWSGVAEFYPSTTVSFVSFKPGVYTLAAGDAWGHLAILYFEVIPAASTLTCAGVSSNSSYVAYTNASVNSGPLGLSAYYKVPGSNDTYLLAMYGTGSSSVTLTYFQFATSWPLQFSPDPTQIQSWQYFTPNGTLAYPATFSPNQCSLVRVVLPYPSTNIVLALEFSNNQSQTFTLRT